MNNYKIFGNKTVDVVIEMGLGACIAELKSEMQVCKANCNFVN